MDRSAARAALAEIAWRRGIAGGGTARLLLGGGGAPGEGSELAPVIALGDLVFLARRAGVPVPPAGDPGDAGAWAEACEAARGAYACAYARAARGEADAVSQRVSFLPGWPAVTAWRTGFLAGPATLDGHPRVLFPDGWEEALPRAALLGPLAFLAEDAAPGALPAASGDIVVSPSRREALAVSAGALVVPDPGIAGPGAPCAWTDLLNAALVGTHLASGRGLESFAATGFSAAVEARDHAAGAPCQ